MKRLLFLGLLAISYQNMANAENSEKPLPLVYEATEVLGYVADVIPGPGGNSQELVAATFWQGIQVRKDQNGVCTKTTHHLSGYTESVKAGVTLHLPDLEVETMVVDCPT